MGWDVVKTAEELAETGWAEGTATAPRGKSVPPPPPGGE